MKSFKNHIIGMIMITPFIISILGWFQGWEAVYRPISNAPIISPYTSLIFIILFLNKLNIRKLEISSALKNKIMLSSIGVISSILFLELVMHTDGVSEILGFPISSISTILTFFLICTFEVVTIENKENSLLIDSLLLLSLFWVYLSIYGHIFEELILTGVHTDHKIGLSLPTAISFLVYQAFLIKYDKSSYTKKLYNSVMWTKRYITLYFLGYIALPFLFVILLKNVTVQPEDHFKIFLSFSLMGLFFITLFIVLIHFLSRTHAGLQLTCKETTRIKTSNGEWISIESYLNSNYGINLKYVSSFEKPESEAKVLNKD